MTMRDTSFDPDGREVWYRQWPDTADGDIDDNGTVRPMTEAEVAEWHARNPPPPLVSPDEWPAEDERIATDALLTRDSVAAQAAAQLLVGKFNALVDAVIAGTASAANKITPQEQAATRAAGMRRLVQLTEPEVRRPSMEFGIAELEQLREQMKG